jgi:chemotaxis signal transduction protein
METPQSVAVEKFVVFTIADYSLALPIVEVLRVVNCPAKTSSELEEIGMIQIDRYVIRVLDLYQQLNAEAVSQLPRDPSFLVIVQSAEGELWGIPVDEPPSVIEFPLQMMRPLPKSGEQFNLLKIASHVAVISQEQETTTIFLADLKRVLNHSTSVQLSTID